MEILDTKIKIRKFLPIDLDRVMEITKISFPQPWPRNEFEKYFEDSFVAEENGKVVGFIIGKILKGMGIIKLVAVDPNYRGQGIGKMLVEFILNYFKERGIKGTLARVRIKNEVGINFFKNFDFEIIKTIKKYYPNGEDAYLMRKSLMEV